MSKSHSEEIIAALWLCAALLADSQGYDTFATVLYVKAGLDVLCSIGQAVAEIYHTRARKSLDD
jgi:hypothetical protein